VNITIVASPIVALGNDTLICSSEPFPVLDAGNAGATYQWFESGNAIAGATAQTYQPNAAGTYSVSVTAGGLCSGTDEIVVTVVNIIPVELGPTQVTCDNGPFPVLDAGIANASYVWTLNGTPIPGATNQTYTANQAGTYSCVVSFSATCSGTDNVDVVILSTPVVSLGTDIEICSNEPFPVLDAGNTGASYQWFESGNAIAGATAQNYQPTAPGTYSVSVTNGGLCTGTDEILVIVNPTLPVALVADQTICSYATYPVLDAGFPGSTYAWSLDGSPVGGNTQTLTTTSTGTYSVLVTSSFGCTGTDDFQLTVIPQYTFDLGEEIFVCLDAEDDPIITAPDVFGNSYEWSLNTDPAFTGNTFAISATGYGTYSVLITDSYGCTATDQVDVNELCEINIPNIFTPGNGDGFNDTFLIENVESNPNTKVVIVNRWGNEVYSSDNYDNVNNVWDGADLPDGTYYYVVVTQTGKEYNGAVKLLRANK
jgi:gliding motility-associated-like protein